MRITAKQLRGIIKEEISRLFEHEQSIVRRGSKLYIVDDEGNEELYDNDAQSSEYAHLRDGEAVPAGLAHSTEYNDYGYADRGSSYGRSRW